MFLKLTVILFGFVSSNFQNESAKHTQTRPCHNQYLQVQWQLFTLFRARKQERQASRKRGKLKNQQKQENNSSTIKFTIKIVASFPFDNISIYQEKWQYQKKGTYKRYTMKCSHGIINSLSVTVKIFRRIRRDSQPQTSCKLKKRAGSKKWTC